MSTDLPATLTSVSTLIAAIGALVLGWRNSKDMSKAKDAATAAKDAIEAARIVTDQNTAEITATKNGVFEVGKRIDGRLSELLKATESAAKALGVSEGRAAERADAAKEKGKGAQ